MAGLLKPYAAEELIPALKDATDLPIHLHTHDTSSIQSATLLKAIEKDVDIVDACLSSVSGLTSQPNLNSMIAAMQGQPREQEFNLESLNQYANYWEDVREVYYPFESGLKAGTAEVYNHEIPGGQYSNLRPQAIALGLEHKFEEVKENYAIVNKMFGDIVKVTPSSKVVGDMAIFMTSNDLTEKDVMEKGGTLAFPESVHDLFKGNLGQPPGGFPEDLSKLVLKNDTPFTDRPNAHLEPIDFDKEFAAFKEKFDDKREMTDFLSYMMYPKVYEDFYQHEQEFGNISVLPTTAFFYGLKQREEVTVELGKGKVIIIKMLYCSPPDAGGIRTVTFDLNGQTRSITIRDESVVSTKKVNRKAVEENEVGTPILGRLAAINVKEGQTVEKDIPLFVIEAMKMESTITAPFAGTIKKIHLDVGEILEQSDLVIEFE